MTQTIDPIPVVVLGNAFASLVEEIGIALMKATVGIADMLSLTSCPPT